MSRRNVHRVFQGDARSLPLAANSVDLVVTSPPYWQKRDYGFDDQIGQEDTVGGYAETLSTVLAECERVLCDYGSVFLNLGDTYEDKCLLGVPNVVESRLVRGDGWTVRNRHVWAKDGGMPDPSKTKLAPRHEVVLHLTKGDYYYDLWGYTEEFGHDDSDVWSFAHDRNEGTHVAPFPRELPKRAIALACPRWVTPEGPCERTVERTTDLDTSRTQAARAQELYEQSDLTEDHLRAIQSVGITDVGKAADVQDGTGRNVDEKERLAAEAKDVLGGYYREYTMGIRKTVGWTHEGAPRRNGVVLDPFVGTGTTIDAAAKVGVDAIGVDADTSHIDVEDSNVHMMETTEGEAVA